MELLLSFVHLVVQFHSNALDDQQLPVVGNFWASNSRIIVVSSQYLYLYYSQEYKLDCVRDPWPARRLSLVPVFDRTFCFSCSFRCNRVLVVDLVELARIVVFPM